MDWINLIFFVGIIYYLNRISVQISTLGETVGRLERPDPPGLPK